MTRSRYSMLHYNNCRNIGTSDLHFVKYDHLIMPSSKKSRARQSSSPSASSRKGLHHSISLRSIEHDCPPVAEGTSFHTVQLLQPPLCRMENSSCDFDCRQRPWVSERDRPDTHTKDHYTGGKN